MFVVKFLYTLTHFLIDTYGGMLLHLRRLFVMIKRFFRYIGHV